MWTVFRLILRNSILWQRHQLILELEQVQKFGEKFQFDVWRGTEHMIALLAVSNIYNENEDESWPSVNPKNKRAREHK